MRSPTKNSRRVSVRERSVASERSESKTCQPEDMGSTRDAVPTTGDTHRNVLVVSCGIGLSHHTPTLILATSKSQASNITEHVGTIPCWKWSDDRTQSVGCFRTGCRGWQLSGSDANVCFTTATRALIVWPTWTWLRKLFKQLCTKL